MKLSRAFLPAVALAAALGTTACTTNFGGGVSGTYHPPQGVLRDGAECLRSPNNCFVRPESFEFTGAITYPNGHCSPHASFIRSDGRNVVRSYNFSARDIERAAETGDQRFEFSDLQRAYSGMQGRNPRCVAFWNGPRYQNLGPYRRNFD